MKIQVTDLKVLLYLFIYLFIYFYLKYTKNILTSQLYLKHPNKIREKRWIDASKKMVYGCQRDTWKLYIINYKIIT